MSVTIVETPTRKKTQIAIRPYVDPGQDNMGLQNYGMVVMDGIFHQEQLAEIEKNGVRRFITGLNEFAPDVKNIQDEQARKAKILEIRKTVAELEKELAGNVVSHDDPEFWNKIKLLHFTNHEFWSRIEIRCGNEPVYLDPEKAEDRIRIYAIEAGGFSLIARSYEVARAMMTPPKFYLDKHEETIASKTEVKKLQNKAISELEKLFSKDTTKLFLVAKVVDGNSAQYKKSVPNDVLYDNMDRFIKGEGVEKNKARAASDFTNACKMSMETLKIKAIIKDASFYKFIAPKSDGFIYHVDSGSLMGKNPAELLEYLKNPLNDKTLLDLMKRVEETWEE